MYDSNYEHTKYYEYMSNPSPLDRFKKIKKLIQKKSLISILGNPQTKIENKTHENQFLDLNMQNTFCEINNIPLSTLYHYSEI